MLGDSFFVSPSVEKRMVKLGDGTEHEMFFRKVSSYEFSRFAAHWGSKIADERADGPNILVAASLCGADGKPILTVEKARELKVEVLDQLFSHALELNRRDKEKPGNA